MGRNYWITQAKDLSVFLSLETALSRCLSQSLKNDMVGLTTILGCQVAMPLQNFLRRQQLFAIARPVRRDLCCCVPVQALLPLVVQHLLQAKARGIPSYNP